MSDENINSEEKLKELQFCEQSLRQLIMQKQTFQFELTETENALKEISNTDDDTFKMIGQIMIKTDKEKLKQELNKKKDLINLRLKSINSREKELTGKLEEIRNSVMQGMK